MALRHFFKGLHDQTKQAPSSALFLQLDLNIVILSNSNLPQVSAVF